MEAKYRYLDKPLKLIVFPFLKVTLLQEFYIIMLHRRLTFQCENQLRRRDEIFLCFKYSRF